MPLLVMVPWTSAIASVSGALTWVTLKYTKKQKQKQTTTLKQTLALTPSLQTKCLFSIWHPQLSSIILQPKCNHLSNHTSKLLSFRDKVFKISSLTKHKSKIHQTICILPSSRNEVKNPDRLIIFKYDQNSSWWYSIQVQVLG